MTKRIVFLAILAAAAGLFFFIRYSPSVAQDRCLDGGGAWRNDECIGRRPNG